ncbi:MAG: cation:proton antiporter [Candidatus Dormibacteria bacterium]
MFAQLALVVAAGLLGPVLATGRRALVPVLVGQLLAGVLLGRSGLGWIDPSQAAFPVFYALGFALLMLTAGTHVDTRSPAMRAGFVRGLGAVVVVGAISAPIGLALGAWLGFPNPLLLSVLLAGSSAAVAFPIIEERNLSGATVSTLIAWIAVADTVTVILLPLTLTGSGQLGGALVADVAIAGAGAVLLAAGFGIRQLHVTQRLVEESRSRGWALQLRVSLLVLLLLAAVAEGLGGSTLVAGFLAGMLLVRLGEPDRLALQISGLANGFLVPVFFVLLGARLDLRALLGDPHAMILAVALGLAAVLVHVVAALAMAPSARVAAGLAGSAQLGLPAAAAALGLASHTLSPSVAAALVAAGCLTLIPAALGASLLVRTPLTSAP